MTFNGAAMFEIEERFGGATKLLDELSDGREGFDKLCQATAILAEQGELVRRHFGYEPGPMLTEETVRALATPKDIVLLRQAVINAVMQGYGREVTDDQEEVDLGLAELEQKKQNDDPRPLHADGGHRWLRLEGNHAYVSGDRV